MVNGRNWADNETECMVEYVIANYNFLTDGINQRKTKRDIDNKWKEVTSRINALCASSEPLDVKRVEKNWFDIKSKAKKAVSRYRAAQKTGDGAIDSPTLVSSI